jgi:NADH dehydrogenase FAD-containing subunit
MTTALPKPTVLVGLGHAHLYALERLAQWRSNTAKAPAHVLQALAERRLLLLSPSTELVYSGAVPGVISGHYSAEQARLQLQGLVHKSGVQHLVGHLVAFDAPSNRLLWQSAEGEQHELACERVSLNTGGVQRNDLCEAAVPGSTKLALKLRPMNTFLSLWPQLALQAQQHQGAGPYGIAVVGAGAAGVELAFAVAAACPHAAVTLLTGLGPGELPGHPPHSGFALRVHAALKAAGVHVLARKVLRMLDSGANNRQVMLDLEGGGQLLCNAPLLAIGSRPPSWLASSGLSLCPKGFVATDSQQRSTSHANVLALARSGAVAVRSGQWLADNLASWIDGKPLAPAPTRTQHLSLLSCANGKALLQWGSVSTQGAWVWWLKDRIDRQFVSRFSS